MHTSAKFKGHAQIYLWKVLRTKLSQRLCFQKNLEAICRQHFLRAAFKFGRRVHFALRRKIQNPPITRVPAIFNGLTNSSS